jgi:transposase-like protein
VESQNLHRRHLSPEHRRQKVAELRSQGMSTREIARKVGAAQSTVMDDLKAGERFRSPAPEEPDVEVAAGAGCESGAVVGEAGEAPDEPARKKAPPPVPVRVTGRDGKQYPASKPKAVPAPEPGVRTPAPQFLGPPFGGSGGAVPGERAAPALNPPSDVVRPKHCPKHRTDDRITLIFQAHSRMKRPPENR